MQPLLMLKQTLEAPYDPGPLLIDGPNIQFTEASQFLSTLTDGKKTNNRFLDSDQDSVTLIIRSYLMDDNL